MHETGLKMQTTDRPSYNRDSVVYGVYFDVRVGIAFSIRFRHINI